MATLSNIVGDRTHSTVWDREKHYMMFRRYNNPKCINSHQKTIKIYEINRNIRRPCFHSFHSSEEDVVNEIKASIQFFSLRCYERTEKRIYTSSGRIDGGKKGKAVY